MASVDITNISLGDSLTQLLMTQDLEPGSDPSYQMCKVLYLYHPLGAKMTETPIKLAQSQKRNRSVQDAPNEVMEAFNKEWARLQADALIANVGTLARVYGLASVVALVDGELQNEPLDLKDLWKVNLRFNVLDPLNTAGSLVLNQIPTSADFMKPVTVRTNGKEVHPTRFMVVMNEQPVYIAYTNSAFGFVGRSVYQRGLFPLKSYVRTMLANDMIAMKLGLLVMKMKKPGSVVDNVMLAIAGLKRALLNQAHTNQTMMIDVEESVETLNMQNVDGAGKFARDNIIKDVAVSADMPAKLLDNETFVAGFAEGEEDAKNVARYIEWIRGWLEPTYGFFERLCMYRAWTPDLFARIQRLHPEVLDGKSFEECFGEWRESFHAEWPSLLIEPESKKVEVEKIKNETVISLLQTILPELDPANKALALQWGLDNVTENKALYPHELDLDWDAIGTYLEEKKDSEDAAAEEGAQGLAKKEGKAL